MLKKLQNLLFEEDDDIEETEEEITEPVPVVKEPVKEVFKPAQEVKAPVVEDINPQTDEIVLPKPAKEEPRTTMQRIDVTQPVPTVQDAQPRRRERSESVFKETKPEETKPTIGITADATITESRRTQKNVKPTKPERKPRKEEDDKPVYTFNPVISPIFGVDEKDLAALKTTTTKTNYKNQKKAVKSSNVTPIISPMYGANADDSPSLIQDNVASSNMLESMTVTSDLTEAEDEIPEFSLDDILKVRDEEFSEEYGNFDQDNDEAPLFPNLTFPDEPESDAEDTVVISKPELSIFTEDDE